MDCNSRLSNSVTISLFINVCLYLCVIFSSNVAAGNKEIHFSGRPVIGRLFKADAVKSTGVGLPTNKFQSPKHELNEDIFHSSTSLGKEGRLDLGDNLNRESRSKSVILSGIKYEVDSSQDKTKKGAYEASKKSIKRNQSVRRRVKRSDNSEHGKLRTVSTAVGDVNSTGRFNASMNITNNIDESSLKKSYAKKAFKRRIEALFTERAGSPRLSEEEVNKTKNLRKQLLNIYVRGKQNKYYTHSNTTTLYRTDLNDEVIKSEKSFLRVRIDIPIESSSDWDLVQEIRNEDENNHLNEGQGRSGLRRIRKIIIPLLLALKLKTAIVVPLLFGAVSLVAFKGLWAGMTALAMVSALALKSLMHGKSSVTYEVRAPPPHYHMPHHVHDYGYHHGYLHPEYHWSRNDDSYKPQGGWRGGEATDHSATNVNSGLDTTSYSTINIDERSEPLSMNCSSSNSATVDEIRTI